LAISVQNGETSLCSHSMIPLPGSTCSQDRASTFSPTLSLYKHFFYSENWYCHPYYLSPTFQLVILEISSFFQHKSLPVGGLFNSTLVCLGPNFCTSSDLLGFFLPSGLVTSSPKSSYLIIARQHLFTTFPSLSQVGLHSGMAASPPS
jgi:hypothetical protein